VVGEPPGKIHEYVAAAVLVPKETDPPAGMVTSEAGDAIAPDGGAVEWAVSWMNFATDGTPALSSRKSM
jgi:hypothetical protein